MLILRFLRTGKFVLVKKTLLIFDDSVVLMYSLIVPNQCQIQEIIKR